MASKDGDDGDNLQKASDQWILAAAAMKERATGKQPFTPEEVDAAVASLYGCLTGIRCQSGVPAADNAVDWAGLRDFLAARSHLPPKDWVTTNESAEQLEALLGSPASDTFQKIFTRVLEGGNWAQAEQAASSDRRPWAVLVSGLNGIRKTTCMHEPWFQEALKTALGDSYDGPAVDLPCGGNAFFRQLDFMVATVANGEFHNLYAGPLCDVQNGMTAEDGYSQYKDAIFARYRTLAETLGVLLLTSARNKMMNVMVETSGRDIASFEYLDQFFPASSNYRKLVIYFTINDIKHAEVSVDRRMVEEMAKGRAVITGSVQDCVNVNAGGPYGSSVLPNVQEDSLKVWDEITSGRSSAGQGWYKACISIQGDTDPGAWTVRPNLGENVYPFSARN